MLSEFITQGYDLENLKPYEDFLIECSKKDYGDLLTQKHHILPKFMKGSNKYHNLIVVSLEDHFNCHFILGNCFEVGSDERRYNLSSAGKVMSTVSRLFKKINIEIENDDFWINASNLINGLLSGENNTFFGKKHSDETKLILSEFAKNRPGPNLGKKFSPETCKKISEGRKEYYKNNVHWNFGRKCSDETKKKISESEKGKKLTDDHIEIISNRMKKNNVTMVRLCVIDGIQYNSIKCASEALGVSPDVVGGRCRSEREEWQNWKLGEKVLKMSLGGDHV